MIFNSITFLIFFILFFLLYWFVFNKSVKHQNLFLLTGSYIFYAWADWRFLFFLIAVSALNYFIGIYIERNSKFKKLLFYLGLVQGIGCLAFFKYFNFFITSFKDALLSLNVTLNLQTLNIIIPLGISFFTFRIISYILDIDKGKIKAVKDGVVFFNYVSFFPSVLSGPIDRAKLFVPQLEKKREFNYSQATDGMRQVLWGLFKKMVIADNCTNVTSQIFSNYETLSGSSLLLGAFLYTIEIYADFSGYSDMAIGLARLIGFNITKNFDFPFFSQNIAEFWRKWHISLTSWVTEYVFTPLSIAFRDFGKAGLILAILVNFTLVGMWHGPKWTYILYGFLNGLYFIPLILKGTMNKKKEIGKDKFFPSIKEFINVAATFTLVVLTIVIFKSNTFGQAYDFYHKLFSSSIFSFPDVFIERQTRFCVMIFVAVMLIAEWLQRGKDHALQIENLKHPLLRLSIYFTLILSILIFRTSDVNFIYLQF